MDTGLSEDQFTCSICLDVFNNPVSTPCGHSFCQSCISSYWDGGARAHGSTPYVCPLCKESFSKRPELHINRTLKEITEKFQMMTSQTSDSGVGGSLAPHRPSPPPIPPRPGEMPGNIFAEMVTRFQQLQPPGMLHVNPTFPGGPQMPNLHLPLGFPTQSNQQHELQSPYSPSASIPMCPIHLRGLEFFCRTDNACICSMCVEAEGHHRHTVVIAHREWILRKSQLGTAEVELKEQICDRQRKVEELRTSIQAIKANAEQETREVLCAFSKLISNLEHSKTQALEAINTIVGSEEVKAQSLLRELEDEIAALQKRSATLSQLAATEDYVIFLKNFTGLPAPPQSKDWSSVSVSSQRAGLILKNVNQMMERLQEEIQKLPEVCRQVTAIPPPPRPIPRVRRVQEYAEDITLDPSTAHPRLSISANGKRVSCSEHHQSVSNNPKRFDRVVCVMAHQGFSSGRHYWEVEVGGKTDWDLGVASQSVNRKGKISVNPAHGYWFLSLRDGTDYAFRTEPSTTLRVNVKPSRIGIFVDFDKGLVSFYDVEAKILIYSHTDHFPDTIHPFFSPCTNKSGQNEAPLTICSVLPLE